MESAVTTHRFWRIVQSVLAFAVFAALIAGSFYLWQFRNRRAMALNRNTQADLEAALSTSTCPLDDKPLCTFLTGWQNVPGYKVSASKSYEDYRIQTEFAASGNRFHLKVGGDETYEFIGVGSTVYARDHTADVWWQQTVPQEYVEAYRDEYQYDFDMPHTIIPASERIRYEAAGDKPCGIYACAVYKVLDPFNASTDSQYIFFDKQSHLLRQVRLEHDDGSFTQQEVSYDYVRIEPPDGAQPVNRDRFVPPRQSQPVTLPSDMQLTTFLERYFNPRKEQPGTD